MKQKNIPATCAIDILTTMAKLGVENTPGNRAYVAAWVSAYCQGLCRGGIIDIKALEKVILLLSNFRNYEKWNFLYDDIIDALGGTDPNDELVKFLKYATSKNKEEPEGGTE